MLCAIRAALRGCIRASAAVALPGMVALLLLLLLRVGCSILI